MSARKPLRTLVVFCLWILLCMAAFPSPAACQGVGKFISVQGEVKIRRAGAADWEAAEPDQPLHEGDAVLTGADSSCTILCTDESQIKLNEQTLLVIKSVAPSPRLRLGGIVPAAVREALSSSYKVLKGEIWLRNKREKFNFNLETPTVNGTIRGTELNVQVEADGSTRITLLEGSICLANEYGEICLVPGEEGSVQPGQAPTKQMLVQPADAVQWSLYYPGIFSFRDLPLSPQPGQTRAPTGPPAVAALIAQGETAYDQGRLGEARQAAEAVLGQQPEHSRALALLGWIALQNHEPEAAAGYFSRVRHADEMAIIGLALSRYRLGEITGAYAAMQAAYRLPPNPTLVAMTGFFAMLAGRVDEARSALEAEARRDPVAVLPRVFLAQIHLVQNRKDAARQEAEAALARHPGSPMVLLTRGLVHLAFFQPEKAASSLEKAVATDPRFVDAYVYLARIWLASDFLNRAERVINQALSLAPRDGTVLSLAGFVRLAFRDYEGAKGYWDQAVKADPRLGEPHLGLAIYHFRHRRFDQGLEAMLTATLLEPRVSLYQSALGKALYQSRDADKALEVWDYAAGLDPKDPTPHLYKGIALSDLNRPGEAIQAINKSIELNDNVAIFRARQSLDRDLAVRNYDLAKSYGQLGLNEWAFSKAVTAVKNDPYNSSAHLFLSKSFVSTTQGPYLTTMAQLNEDLYFRLLSPANQNTFLSIRNDNYTPMFEMPFIRVLAQGGIGAWREKNSIQDHSLVVYGGRPGLGAWVEGFYVDDRGFRDRNSHIRQYSLPNALVKWDPTVKTSVQATAQYADLKAGDISFLNDYAYINDPQLRLTDRFQYYDVGLVHRFNPKATFLAYYTYQKWHFFHVDLPFGDGSLFNQVFDREFHNFQAQQNLVLGRHNFIAGFDYFSGRNYYKQAFSFMGMPISEFGLNLRTPERTYSFYLFDFWRLHPKVLLELGLIKDFAKSSRDGPFRDSLYNSQWNPILGANLFLTPKHTVRLAYQRHMMTHAAWYAFPLIPTETAGLAWLVFAYPGSDMRNIGLAWEAEWDDRTFSVARIEANRISTPNYDDFGARVWQTWNTYRGTIAVNRILANPLGLTVGVVGQRVVPDLNFTAIQQTSGQPFKDFFELRGYLLLSFLHRTGWQAAAKTTFLQQYLKDRADNTFALVDLQIGKEFAHKRGLATLEVTNLFNRRFFYALEPTFSQDLFPARRIFFKLAFYF
jgi:tetratricopeptide (TPR) repeat protein